MPCIGNLQYLLAVWDWIIHKKILKNPKKKNFTTIHKKTENQNCVKSGLSEFLFLQQKMKYVDLIAIFIILLII